MMGKSEIALALAAMNIACQNPQAWDRWQTEHNKRDVILEFPLGELMNPAIAGFVWAWKMQGRIEVCAIPADAHFNAQGLEGMARVHTDLCVALMVWRDLPAHRCNIR